MVLGVLGAVVSAALLGCGSHDGAQEAPVFEGTYVPADPSTKAELSMLTLNAHGTYSSVQPGCQSSACRSHGTFTFDGEHTLTLDDAVTHAAQTLTVSSVSLGDAPAPSTPSSAGGSLAKAGSSIAALVSGGGGALVSAGGSSGAIVDSATMNGVAMKRRKNADLAAPRVFVSPNSDVLEGATDWQTPFAHPKKWPTTLASGTVIQLYESDIAAIVAATPFFASMVESRHLQVSIEATPLVSDACDDGGYPSGDIDAQERFVASYTAALMNNDFQPLYDAGVTITYAQLDGDGIEPVVSDDPSLHCNFTVEQAAQAQVYFLEDMATTHPEIQFGLIANFPAYNYIDTICYWGTTEDCDLPFPGRDYADVLDAQISIIQGAGQSIYFVHVDNPYMYFFNHPTLDDVMGERLLPLRDQVVSRGLRFGLIMNAEIIGVDGAAGDQPFHDQTVADATYAATSGLGSEDDFIVESWFDYPSRILPETTPNTFAATANDTLAAFLTASGR